MKAKIKSIKEIMDICGEIDSNGDYNFETVDVSKRMLKDITMSCEKWVPVYSVDEDGDFKFAGYGGTYPKEIIGALSFKDVEEFEEMYELEVNEIDGDGEQNLFETYGEELKYVLGIANTEPNRVWSCIDGDDGQMYISKGYQQVNCFGYYITKESCPFEVEDFLYCDELGAV